MSTDWKLDPKLQLMCPTFQPALAVEASTTSLPKDEPPAFAYIAPSEALRWMQPWASVDAAEASQCTCHARAAGDAFVRGYISWFSPQAAVAAAGDALIVQETASGPSGQIWEAAWLLRNWAMQHASLFPLGTSVLELGAGYIT